MAVKPGFRFTPSFDEIYPKGLVASGEVSAVLRYNPDRNAPKVQKLDINELTGEIYTGLRMWKVQVNDPDQDKAKRASFEVTLLSEHQPVFPASATEIVANGIQTGMRMIRLENLQLEPTVVRQGSGDKNFSYVEYKVYATGFVGDNNTPKAQSRNGSDVKAVA